MTVISLTITESTEQIISGIPTSVTVQANQPATIFYTLDGTLPTVDSLVTLGSIQLPTDVTSVTLNVFATNGTDSSAVVSETYGPNLIGARLPGTTVIGLSANPEVQFGNFPFGDENPIEPIQFGRSGGVTADDPSVPNQGDGYDGAGGLTGGTDQPISSYQRIFSDSDFEGQTGRGVGTIPGHVTFIPPAPPYPTSSSKTSSNFFNPKAAVIYQDSREPVPESTSPQFNRIFSSLVNLETDKDGSTLDNGAFEGNLVSMAFVRSAFNPVDNTITYYYRDSVTNRWIISVEPFTPKPGSQNLYAAPSNSRSPGANKVFNWFTFTRRVL